jgi:hypothetical protein
VADTDADGANVGGAVALTEGARGLFAGSARTDGPGAAVHAARNTAPSRAREVLESRIATEDTPAGHGQRHRAIPR